jgi:hypothetical protein
MTIIVKTMVTPRWRESGHGHVHLSCQTLLVSDLEPVPGRKGQLGVHFKPKTLCDFLTGEQGCRRQGVVPSAKALGEVLFQSLALITLGDPKLP